MIVYVVTTRIGDRCRIEGVFDDRRQAAYYCAVKNEWETQMEEWDTEGVKFSGNRKLLSRWYASIGSGDVVNYVTEGFTFDEETRFDDQGNEGWYVTLTTEYGLSEEQACKIILERFEEWKTKETEK